MRVQTTDYGRKWVLWPYVAVAVIVAAGVVGLSDIMIVAYHYGDSIL